MLTVFVSSRLLFPGGHKKGAQQEPFFSGNEVEEGTHLAASNLYWGFFKALEGYYSKIIPEHTGNINDYVGWLVVVTALIMIMLAMGGGV